MTATNDFETWVTEEISRTECVLREIQAGTPRDPAALPPSSEAIKGLVEKYSERLTQLKKTRHRVRGA